MLNQQMGKARITSLVIYLVLDVVFAVAIILFAEDPVVSVGLGLASGLGAIGLVIWIVLEAMELRRHRPDDRKK